MGNVEKIEQCSRTDTFDVGRQAAFKNPSPGVRGMPQILLK
jgi:hypothetical protein